MGTHFLDRQVAIADFHHIHIIVRKEINRGQVVNVFTDDRFYELPGWAGVDTVLSKVKSKSRDNATHLESPDMRQE